MRGLMWSQLSTRIPPHLLPIPSHLLCTPPPPPPSQAGNIAEWLDYFPSWDLERQSAVGFTALHHCVFTGASGKLSTLRCLLKNGANPLHLARNGASLIHSATKNQFAHESLLRELLALPRLVQLGSQCQRASAWSSFSAQTSLALARKRGLGVSLELRRWDGGTPLHNSAQQGNLAIVQLLLSEGAADSSVTVKRHGQRLTAAEQAELDFGGILPPALAALLQGQRLGLLAPPTPVGEPEPKEDDGDHSERAESRGGVMDEGKEEEDQEEYDITDWASPTGHGSSGNRESNWRPATDPGSGQVYLFHHKTGLARAMPQPIPAVKGAR